MTLAMATGIGGHEPRAESYREARESALDRGCGQHVICKRKRLRRGKSRKARGIDTHGSLPLLRIMFRVTMNARDADLALRLHERNHDYCLVAYLRLTLFLLITSCHIEIATPICVSISLA